MNIVDNAIKYTPENNTINIELKKEKDQVIINIADTGMGIPESDISKIFDRFYRVDKARSKDIQGTGLGLSIVKWIIDCHKGKIIVFSVLKKGTTFKIQLPVKQSI
jgi:signal transduction histidine kinase